MDGRTVKRRYNDPRGGVVKTSTDGSQQIITQNYAINFATSADITAREGQAKEGAWALFTG